MALLAVALLASPTGAAAQQEPIDTTTSTTTTTTTTTTPTTTTTEAPPAPPPPPQEPPPAGGGEPPPQPPPTTAPPAAPTRTGPPPGAAEGVHVEDSAPDDVPVDPVEIPPPATPLPPDPAAPFLQQITASTLAQLRKSLGQAAAARGLAQAQVDNLTAEVASMEARLGQLEQDQRDAVARLQAARLQLRRRAVASYIGTPAAQVNTVLDSTSLNDLSRRFELMGAVVKADRARVEAYDAAKREVSDSLEKLVLNLDQARSALVVARAMLEGATSSLFAKQVLVGAAQTGGELVAKGWAFPVGGPHNFVDTFGAPRMFGTPFAHLHQGTDIFAAEGTPLVACERGVLARVGTDTLGGTKLWLVGQSGTRYYYAHLSAFAEGVTDGKLVEAGDVVGYVGRTGNAATTPAHLHFQVHPGGGPAVNPYPLLKIVDEAQARLAAGAAAGPRQPNRRS